MLMKESTRRDFIRTTAVAGGIGVAGCVHDGGPEDDEGPGDNDTGGDEGEPQESAAYEVWALDQGTDLVHVYDADEQHSLTKAETLDLKEHVDADGVTPHMIDYSSDYEYAAVACTGGASVVVVRTEDKEVVEVLETGPASHFASFAPDDSFLQVDVIGEGAIKRVDADLDSEEFEIVDEIDTNGLHESFDGSDPVCHQYTGGGYSYHTLGPSYHDGGVVVVDTAEFEVEKFWTHDELPANCGTIPHPTEDKFYMTAGLPSNPEEDEEGVGEYYVLDTTEHEVVASGDTGGIDAHGFWFPPGEDELWALNRETNDGVVIDPETDEVVEEIDSYAPEDEPGSEKPDIMWSSPDGEKMYVTLRGPNPQSATHVAEGDTPGFSVLDVDSREVEQVVQPDEGNEASDFHGIGVVPRELDGEYTSPAW